MNLPWEQHGLYRKWLIETAGVEAAVLPDESYAKIKPGIILPYPTGCAWNALVGEGSRKHKRANYTDVDANERAIDEAKAWIANEVRTQKGGKFCFNIQKSTRAMVTARELKTMRSKQGAKKKKTEKAVAMGKEPSPANTRAALEASDKEDWVESMGVEFYGLVEKGVFELGYTRKQLVDQGILSPPVPCAPYYERKYGADGECTKKKTRIAIQGHPGNMQKGVHYHETFSATPREGTARILCALVCKLNLTRAAFDITKAYCWADLPPGELIALYYPEGFKEFDKVTGEELFMVLRKNLYGHPAAGRTFGKQRDTALLDKFNCLGWSCKRTRMDPCLFVIHKEYKIGQEIKTQRLWMLVHVDDAELVGESDQIVAEALEVCKSIWDCSEVDSEFMLGVRRRITHTVINGQRTVESVECDMIAFVEGMQAAFKEHLPIGNILEPTPPKFTASMQDELAEGEAKEVLEAGYMSAMGMLLWAARRIFATCKVGVSVLCRVMSKPSWACFRVAMQMIAWMYQNRTQGLKFTRNVCKLPIGLVDASNKPDPKDGKCQYGWVFMWMGAAAMDSSKKLRHIGLSSEHNEYMAMHFAHQALVWMRQLFQEMGLDDLLIVPTVMLADNKAANQLSREDIVTCGNQYIYLPYHYNKEVQEEGFSEVQFIKSQENIADLMTKSPDTKVFLELKGPLTGYDLRLSTRLWDDAYKNLLKV